MQGFEALRSFVAFCWRLGQGLENDRYESYTVSGAEQCGEDGENLCRQGRRNDIAIAYSREGDNLIIEVVDQRAALGGGHVRRVRQEVIFEGEDGQKTAKKERPEHVPKPNKDRFTSRLLEKMEERAQGYAIHHKNRREPQIEEIIGFRA